MSSSLINTGFKLYSYSVFRKSGCAETEELLPRFVDPLCEDLNPQQVSLGSWLFPLPPGKIICCRNERSNMQCPIVSLSFSRLASKTRTQSPSSSPQYHRSPTRCHPNQNNDRKGEDKKLERRGEQPKAESATRTNAETKNLNSSSQGQFVRNLSRETHEKNHSPDRRNQMSLRPDPSERRLHVNGQNGDKGEARFTHKCIKIYLNAHFM